MSVSDLELIFAKSFHGKYTIAMKLKRDRDDSRQEISPLPTQIDLNVLHQKWQERNSFATYGEELSKQVFSNHTAKENFIRYFSGALDHQCDLRIRIVIAHEAQELHQLFWETLHEPFNNHKLATMERVRLTRQILSADMRPTKPEQRENIKSVVAVSNPTDLIDYRLSMVNVAEETDRATYALRQTQIVPAHSILTLDNLLSDIRAGADILYLVCHGALSESGSTLYLQKNDGKTHLVSGQTFVDRLSELHKLPRLIVLASCQSAGAYDAKAFTALGPKLAAIGVPAVLAMQGNISMETIKQFSPIFFDELNQHGKIDHALSVARCRIQHCHDFWMPVLYLRSESGLLWHPRQSRPRQNRPLPPLLPYMANRALQEETLKSVVGKRQGQSNCPILMLVHGDELQSQDMLFKRMRDVAIPKVLGLDASRTGVFERSNLRWPERLKSLRELHLRLLGNLGDEILDRPKATALDIQNMLAQLPGPVVLRTHIPFEDWKNHGKSALDAYLGFWQNWPDLNPRQDLFIFVFLTYPKPDTFLGGLLSRRRNDHLRRDLETCSFEQYPRLNGATLPMLTDVTRHEAEEWARMKELQDFCDLPDLHRKIREMFAQCGGQMPMETLAEKLKHALQAPRQEELYT